MVKGIPFYSKGCHISGNLSDHEILTYDDIANQRVSPERLHLVDILTE